MLTVAPRLHFYLTEMGYTLARRTTDKVGLLISSAAVNFDRAKAFVSGEQANREAAVIDFNAMVAALHDVAAKRFHIDGAFDKMLARFADPDFPLELLPPYAGANDDDYARFRAMVPPSLLPLQ